MINQQIDKTYVIKQRDELKQNMVLYRQYIRLLLDVATGYKEVPAPRFKLARFQNNDLRLISTIKNLHSQIREMEKEYKLIQKILPHLQETAS